MQFLSFIAISFSLTDHRIFPWLFSSLPAHGLVSTQAGEIWYAASVMSALLLFGLAVFFFFFGAFPYWFKVHKHLHEILGCKFHRLRFRKIKN